jgi:microcystin-dependent protein
MATITGLTADRMKDIEDASIVDGEVISGSLILTKHDGTTIDAGPVVGPPGPTGPMGPASISAIPGEVRLWPGSALPALGEYGKWVWANGAVYVVATYPKAAANIASQWRTFAGASDPGAGNFRVPDVRGLVPAGLDQMPGDSARANRMTRSVAITIAARTGEETHVITIPEMPAHDHPVNDPGHSHPLKGGVRGSGGYRQVDQGLNYNYMEETLDPGSIGNAFTSLTLGNRGGNGAHENVQPTVFVPYIVKLDD